MAFIPALARAVYNQGYLPIPGRNVTRQDAATALQIATPILASLAATGTVSSIAKTLSTSKGLSHLSSVLHGSPNVPSSRPRKVMFRSPYSNQHWRRRRLQLSNRGPSKFHSKSRYRHRYSNFRKSKFQPARRHLTTSRRRKRRYNDY